MRHEREPNEIVIGETLKWSKRLRDYSPADGWALTYSFRGPGTGLNVTATTDSDGRGFEIVVPFASTAAMSPGLYSWQAWASNGIEKYLVSEGESQAVASLASQDVDVSVDNRSQAKKILDAIDAVIANTATIQQMRVTVTSIGGAERTLQNFPPSELLAVRERYARIYAAEQLQKKGRSSQTIRTRFV